MGALVLNGAKVGSGTIIGAGAVITEVKEIPPDSVVVGAPHMYFSKEKKKWVFPVNNFSLNYSGNYREFYACHFISPNATDRIEIGDYELNASCNGKPAVVFDKGVFLDALFEEGKKAGVQYYLERNVISVRKMSGGVQIKTAEGDALEGTFCSAADGIISRLAKITALNKERLFINTRKSISHYVTGVEFERSEAIFLGISYDAGGLGPVPFCLLPSVYRDDEYWFFVSGDQQFEFLTKRRNFKRWFPRLEITHTRANVVNNWSPASPASRRLSCSRHPGKTC